MCGGGVCVGGGGRAFYYTYIYNGKIIGLGFVYLGDLERLSFRAVKQWVERNGRNQRTGRAQKERGPGFVGTH